MKVVKHCIKYQLLSFPDLIPIAAVDLAAANQIAIA